MSTILRDAWRTLVPLKGDPHGPLAPMLVVLTTVTGLIDAFSYLVLGHVFVANMTGNVVFCAFALAGAKGFSLSASLLALGSFSVGAVVAGRIDAVLGPRRGRVLSFTTGGEVLLVSVALTIAALAVHPGTGTARYVIIGVMGMGAGMQNGMARRIAVPELTTTVLTMTLTGISFDSRLAGGGGSRIGRRLLAVLAMFAGALVGAVIVLHVQPAWALAVALALLVPLTGVAASLSRSHPAWENRPS